ncbi:MAG: AAA family ATPase [Syntrophobacteraceae bacterium]
MDNPERFERVCRAMSDPAFYLHSVSGLEMRQTHISAVFLTGEWVYKLKKPLNFGFLDYTGLETRRRMCELEVKLNQRLSRGVYDDVIPIRRAGGGFSLEGAGEIVEYAVKMTQLPEVASLSNLLAAGVVNRGDMEKLGRRLAAFYSGSEKNGEIDLYGGPEIISCNTEENFRQLEPFVGTLLKEELFETVKESSRGFFKDYRGLFNRRVDEKRICDGHGDLRVEHVYFLDEIQIIDCIEFNERFRYGDVAVDLAFLHMDIERLGYPELSVAVLEGYTEISRDFGVYTVLDFYSCYRAIVKMKVSCLTWTELEEGARKKEMEARAAQYLDLAFRYAVQFSRPVLWIICGLPGSGKSAWSEMLSDLFGIAMFSSDEARKDLPEYRAHTGPVPFGEGIYRKESRGRVYSRLLSLAQEELKKGRSVIVDATFSLRKWREEALRLAADTDASILFIECCASKEVIAERVGRRGSEAGGGSDARLMNLSGLLDEFEEFDTFPIAMHLKVDTTEDVSSNLGRMLSSAYAMKRTQVEDTIAKCC